MTHSDNNFLKEEILQVRQRAEAALAALEQGDEQGAKEILGRDLSLVRDGRHHPTAGKRTAPTPVPEKSRVIEGVFDGQHMIGDDGKQYLVPPNYISKSKLVEGDMMKLAITPDGAFVYKQIGPIARKRVAAKLTRDGSGMWNATDGVHSWRLLTAAVTYFQGSEGDEAIILIPSGTPSKWGAVENIICR